MSLWVTVCPRLLGMVVMSSRAPFAFKCVLSLDNILNDQLTMIYEEWHTCLNGTNYNLGMEREVGQSNAGSPQSNAPILPESWETQ